MIGHAEHCPRREQMNSTTPTSDLWRQGRAHCPTCGITRQFVAHVDVSELRCGICDTLCHVDRDEDTVTRYGVRRVQIGSNP
jgi:uncharacterized protein (DUF983 family)